VKIEGEPPPLLKSAVKSVESVVKTNTDNTDQKTASDLLVEGHEFLKAQKDREAIKAFKESIKLNPNTAETYYGLGFSSFRLGKFREAADAFKKATALNPQMAKAHYGLSLAYQELGNTSALLGEYRSLERLDKTLARKLAQTFPQYNFSCRLVQGCP
jgi:tetratricopeptide (TPR) repeat protein